MPIKQQLLNHFKYLKATVNEIGASALVDIETFQAQVRKNDLVLMLYPQFVTYRYKKKRYTYKYDDTVVRFCGWRPYQMKSAEIFAFKTRLKDELAKFGIRMPVHTTKSDVSVKDVLIKRQLSSFANTIRGPFASTAGKSLNSEMGEYYESFIRGDILKIWYWDEMAVCYERQAMPLLKGDGKSTLLELIQQRVDDKHYKEAVDSVRDVLLYQGKQLDSVLDIDESILIDFRYGSRLSAKDAIQDIKIDETTSNEIKEQLTTLGKVLWRLLPEDIRQAMVFTVDAILDEKEQVWFLEANANPFIHPFIYQSMIQRYFSGEYAKGNNQINYNAYS